MKVVLATFRLRKARTTTLLQDEYLSSTMSAYSEELVASLRDPARPVFLFGSTPPLEGTTDEKIRDIAEKFSARSWVLACDGFVVYDIQDEAGRTSEPRPFPFRRTVDPSGFGAVLSAITGKSCVICEYTPPHSCIPEFPLSLGHRDCLSMVSTRAKVRQRPALRREELQYIHAFTLTHRLGNDLSSPLQTNV